MIGWVVTQSVKFRVLVLLVAVLATAFGFAQARQAPVDVLPEFSPTYVEVQTEALGLSATEVEQMITVPLEADLLNGVAWLDSIRSESVPGLSSITLVFDPGTDIMRARQVVSERLTQAHAIPNVSKPPVMLEPLSSSSRVMMVGLTAKDLSLIDTSVLARWTIRPKLMGVPGVANVSIWGMRDQQLQVLVDPQRLASEKVSLAQILETAGNAMWVSPLSFLEASTPGTGGFIDTANQRLSVQHVTPITSPRALSQVTVADTDDRVVRLGDVTDVVAGHQPLIGDAANGDGPSLMLVVEKLPGANALEVTRGVDAALDELRPGLSGIEIDNHVFRPATFIEEAVANVGLWLLIGGILLLLAIGLVTFHWRFALVTSAAVLASFGVALAVLLFMGVSLNAMLLAGVVAAAALMIGDAVLDVDRMRARRADLVAGDASGDREPRLRAVVDAAVETRTSMLFGVAITALAALPVLFLSGQTGVFYRPIAVAYLVSVGAAMLVALTLVPALGAIVLTRGRPVRRQSAVLDAAGARYERGWPGLVRGRKPVLATAAALLVAGIAAVPFLTTDGVPTARDRDLLVTFNAAPGTSLPAINRITGLASRELRGIEGVRNVGLHVGRAVLGDQVTGVNAGELWVSIDASADYARTVNLVHSAVAGYPGISARVLTYEKSLTEDILGGPVADITVRVYGQDDAILRAKAAEVRDALAGVEGVSNSRVQAQVEEPTLVVEVDLDRAEPVGIKPGDVRRASATLISGLEVGQLFEDQKVFDVVVRGTADTQRSLTSVRELLVESPNGKRVRLGDVADVRVAAKPAVIHRADVSRTIDITADVSGRSVAAATEDARAKLAAVAFPLEYHAEVLGDAAQARANTWRTASVSIAVAIGVFLLLQSAFRSWTLAALMVPALGLALSGGVLAAALGGRVLTVGSLLGLLAVFGVAARACVALVRHYQRLEEVDGMPSGPELVARGTREQLGPIVLTAVATAVLFLPLLFLGGIAGLEILQPMAVTVLGGLITTTFLTLVVVPLIYLGFGTRRAEPVLADGPGEDGLR